MEIPRLEEVELRRRAADLLSKLNPKGGIPVPIERIVEFEFQLDIVPVPGLLTTRGINGFLTSDRTAIYVDDGLLRRGAKRYLFTLAHELSHLVLHAEHYESFASEADWERFHASLAIHSIASAEWQADTFAGLLLVPPDNLRQELRKLFPLLSDVIRASAPTFDLKSEAFWDYVAKELGRTFDVSKDTARIRLQNDKMWSVVPPA